jgi:hypothetical protein
MSAIIHRRKPSTAGFSLTELLISTFIAFYVIATVAAIYVIISKWSKEVSPDVEAQRVARTAVDSVIYGSVDSTAGVDTIGMNTYDRRNGVAWAAYNPDSPPSTPVISGTNNSILSYRLDGDSSNTRQATIGTDVSSGLKGVYYNGALIKPTLGITDLRFDYFTSGGVTYYDIIKVEASVVKPKTLTKAVNVRYSNYANIKNRL